MHSPNLFWLLASVEKILKQSLCHFLVIFDNWLISASIFAIDWVFATCTKLHHLIHLEDICSTNMIVRNKWLKFFGETLQERAIWTRMNKSKWSKFLWHWQFKMKSFKHQRMRQSERSTAMIISFKWLFHDIVCHSTSCIWMNGPLWQVQNGFAKSCCGCQWQVNLWMTH